MKKTALTYEQALTKLEAVVAEMEQSDTPLDKAMKLYKEGLGLAQTCGDILSRYEREVSLLQQENGEFILKPFNNLQEDL